MSEPVKFKTFRDLRNLPKEVEEDKSSSTSTASLPSGASSTSITSLTSRASRGSVANKTKLREVINSETSPTRDYQKVPNSVTRIAVPAGAFRGKSKQVWDYFWSISRGAINPARTFKKSRKEIKDGSGLGSMVTVDAAIGHLQALGLVKVKQIIGSGWGNEYEVFTPDEINLTSTSSTSISSTTSLTQKVDILDMPESSISSITQPVEKQGIYSDTKTSLKTNTTDDEAFAGFINKFQEAATEIAGKRLSNRDAENLEKIADLLILELKIAASRTSNISSIPAFLTEVLRRKLRDVSNTTKPSKVKADLVGKAEPVCYEIKPLNEQGREAALTQLHEFAADDFLPEFEKWYTPEDWTWLMKELKKN